MALLDALLQAYYHTFKQPDAMSRVTRTPIYWGGVTDPNNFAQHSSVDHAIYMNKNIFPQDQMPSDLQSGVLRHEQVHALMDQNPQAIQNMNNYMSMHPDVVGRSREAFDDPRAARVYTPEQVAKEAPAYMAQGINIAAKPNSREDYINAMPDAIRQRYLRLLGPGAAPPPASVVAQSQGSQK